MSKKIAVIAIGSLLLIGCAYTPPTPIGADTYFSSKTNSAGAFGSPEAVAGHLMVDGNKFCAAKGREFQLVSQNISPTRYAQSLGSASITFKCVEHAEPVRMRPDNGVTTIENR